jgi:hypothetical protein
MFKKNVFVFSRFCPPKANFRETGASALFELLLWSLTQKRIKNDEN